MLQSLQSAWTWGSRILFRVEDARTAKDAEHLNDVFFKPSKRDSAYFDSN